MLKIETLSVGNQTVLKLIGRLRSENLRELAAQMAGHGAHATLDMGEVTLVDIEVVRFLMQIDPSGTRITNCPLYIREWMNCERKQRTGT